MMCRFKLSTKSYLHRIIEYPGKPVDLTTLHYIRCHSTFWLYVALQMTTITAFCKKYSR